MLPLLRPLPRQELSQEEFYTLGPPKLWRFLWRFVRRRGGQSSASTSTDCAVRAPPAMRRAPLTGETSK